MQNGRSQYLLTIFKYVPFELRDLYWTICVRMYGDIPHYRGTHHFDGHSDCPIVEPMVFHGDCAVLYVVTMDITYGMRRFAELGVPNSEIIEDVLVEGKGPKNYLLPTVSLSRPAVEGPTVSDFSPIGLVANPFISVCDKILVGGSA